MVADSFLKTNNMNEEATQILFTVIISLAVVVTIVVAIMFCGWCFGKKNDDEDDDESDAEIKKLSQKYSSVPTAEQEAIDVRQLNKRASRTPQTQGADNPMFVSKNVFQKWRNKQKKKSESRQSLVEVTDGFERPAERRVVTEHVQPSPTAATTLQDSLGARTSSYQTMANMHRPLTHSDSVRSQGSATSGAEETNSSVWKGMRNIANMLMDDSTEVEATAPPIDPSEGVDCKLGRIQIALSYDFQNLTLTLKIFQATSLPAKDFTGTSDPYVKVLLLPDKKHKLLTKVKKKNLNPRWNECFLFEGWPHNKLLEKTLYLQVIDYDRFSRDDPIGETYIPLNEIDLSQSPSMWRFLQPCKDSRGKLGELLLSLCYQPSVGRLTVVVMKAKDLKAKDITGASDPYVKLWLMYGREKVEKKKTSIKMRTLNPVYNESFIYEIPWERIREAAVEVSVMDFDKVGRNELIGKIMLSSKSGPLETRHWNDMISKPRQQVAQWHLLKD